MKGPITCFIAGVLTAISIAACSMGGRAARILQENGETQVYWDFCKSEMTHDYKGKLCLMRCEIELEKNGDCKKDKKKWIVKDLKEHHEFFMDKFIAVPEHLFF